MGSEFDIFQFLHELLKNLEILRILEPCNFRYEWIKQNMIC